MDREDKELSQEEQELLAIFDPIMDVKISPNFLDGVLNKTEISPIETTQSGEEAKSPDSPKVIVFPKAHKQRNWWRISTIAQAAVIVLMGAWLLNYAPDDSPWHIDTRRGGTNETQLLTQGDQYAETKRYSLAQEAYEKYLKSNAVLGENIGGVLRRLSVLHYESGNYQDSYELASAAVILNPQDACAYWYRGAAAYILDRSTTPPDTDGRARTNWHQAQRLGDVEAVRSLQELQASQEKSAKPVLPKRQTQCAYLP